MASGIITPSRTGKSRAVVLVKAVPQASGGHGETVCVAALDEYGNWHRIYPVNFRSLGPTQKFGRWDQIEFDWRLPEISKDRRRESKRIDQESVCIVGELKQRERLPYLRKAIVEGTDAVYKAGGSLALVRPVNPVFGWRKRTDEEISKISQGYKDINASPDLFGTSDIVPREAADYEFHYSYRDTDRQHDKNRCHDWETEQTFLNWRDHYGEERALADMKRVFGEEYPAKGMAFAMGTHGQRNWQWMIIGVLRLDDSSQTSFL